MSLAQPQVSATDDVIPPLPRPSSILQKQSSFTRGGKRAVHSSEINNSATLVSAAFVNGKPAHVSSDIRPRINPVIENKSAVHPSDMPRQGVEVARKVLHPYSTAPPPKSVPPHIRTHTSEPVCIPESISVPTRAPATIPARTLESISVPTRAPATIPARTLESISVPTRAPAVALTRASATVPTHALSSPSPASTSKATSKPAKKVVSTPRPAPQPTMSGDSSAQKLPEKGGSHGLEGARRVPERAAQPVAAAPMVAPTSASNNYLSNSNSFEPSRLNSFCGGIGSMGNIGFQNPLYESMYGLMGSAYGSVGPRQMSGMGGSLVCRGMEYGTPGSMQDLYPSTYGSFQLSNNFSMYPIHRGSFIRSFNGSLYDPGRSSFMNSFLYDNPYANTSFYSELASRRTSSYGLAAQWSSLADISGFNCSHTPSSSIYNDYQAGSTCKAEDLYPKSEQDTCVVVKRSGRRGGKQASCDTRKAKTSTQPINTKINIKRAPVIEPKEELPYEKQDSVVSNTTLTGNEVSQKPRAAVPTSYDVHTLIIVDKSARGKPDIVVSNPNTVVLQKNGSETFECDEALHRSETSDEVDSVLFSDLRSNWLAGHCSAILACAGKGKNKDAICVVHNFVRRCLKRLEKAPATTFDVSINMCQLRGANQCLDLLSESTGFT